MGELPDERMREAVEAVVSREAIEAAALAHCTGREHDPKMCPALPIYIGLARKMLEAALPFLGGLPPKPSLELIAAADDMAGWLRGRLRTAESEPLWREMRAALDRYEAAADEVCRVDARPSGAPAGWLELSDEEIRRVTDLISGTHSRHTEGCSVCSAQDSLRAELARRQGTGQ